MFRLLITVATLSLAFCGQLAWAQNRLPGDTSFEAGSAQWLGGRSDTLANAPDGKRVLTFLSAYCHSLIYDDLIQADQPYSLSFQARSTGGSGYATLKVMHVKYGQVGSTLELKMTNAWQQYQLFLPPQRHSRTIYLTINQPDGQQMQLDALMLNTGNKPQAYVSQNDCLVSIDPTGAPGNILFQDEALPRLKIGILNRTQLQQSGHLHIRTVDWYGNVCNTKDVPLSLEAGQTAQLDYQSLKQMTRGYYQVIAQWLSDEKQLLARDRMAMGVVGRPVEMASHDSFFGIHADPSRVTLPAMSRIGARWLRVFENWHRLERQPGKYAMDADIFEQASQLDMSVICSLKIAESMPKGPWSDTTLATYSERLTELIQWLGGNAPQAIKVWEIENEPDLIYPTHLKSPLQDGALAYGRILNIAGRAFKRYCPNRSIAAMAVSGNETDNRFIKPALQGNEQSFDIASVHPYTGARFISRSTRVVAPDAYIREYMQTKSKVMPNKRLWAGEVGWAFDTLEPLESDTYRTYSNNVARALILLKSVPQVEKVLWFKAQGCYERDQYQYGLWHSEFQPLAAAVFYANIAEKLENTKAYQPVSESDLRVYTFTDLQDKPFAAAWQYKGDIKKILVDQPIDKVHVTDLFGNDVALTTIDQKTSIPISQTPVWITIDGLSPEQLVDVLGRTDVGLPPVVLTPFLCNDQQAVIFAHNNLNVPLPVSVQVNGREIKSLTMQAGEDRSVTLSVESEIASGQVTVTCVTPKGDVQMLIALDKMLACRSVNGATSKMPDLLAADHVIELNRREEIYPPDGGIAWESPADLSGRFASSYDADYFYFQAQVTDPVHYQKAEKTRGWTGDSIQLAFDTLADAREGEFAFDPNDCEWLAWLSPSGPRLTMTHGDPQYKGKIITDAIIQINRHENYTYYRMAIPWKYMKKLTPMHGRIFGMNFIVNQNNGNGRNYWLGLTQGIGEGKYPFLYRQFRLEQTNSAR